MDDVEQRLSQIETCWTELGLARGAMPDVAADARAALLRRYAGPVYRYLLACVHSEDVADDLAQEFAVRFLEGRFAEARPDRGRFRDFLKRSVSNLATDHFRKAASEKHRMRKLQEDQSPLTPGDSFDGLWKNEVLRQTWKSFKAECEQSDSHFYTVLRHRAEFPDQSAAEMAVGLTDVLGRSETPTNDWVRQNLSRARKRFGQLLREEVARTVGNNQPDAIDEELAELGLLSYCT